MVAGLNFGGLVMSIIHYDPRAPRIANTRALVQRVEVRREGMTVPQAIAAGLALAVFLMTLGVI
jgi:hypothetical protein